jgi:ABC-type multidrug transport system fused ATPase/permease subunit
MLTHRLSSVPHCDHILMWDRGQLVEQGRHDQLLRARGVYYSVWRLGEQAVAQ